MSDRSYQGNLPPADVARVNSLRVRLKAGSNVEAIRRAVITVAALLDVMENGGDVVLCRPGMDDKVVWFI